MSTIVFMFSGQGSQYYQMGGELFEKHPPFREVIYELDAISHLIGGQSIISHLYSENNRKIDIFDQTLHTHPAIFMVEYALAQILLDRGIRPDYVLGTSIGEFASAALANVISPEKALLALIRQAETLESSCERGGMLAILYDPSLYQETPLLRDNSELVSINFSLHFVISGLSAPLQIIEEFLKERQINFQELPVTRAFHSSFIDPAAEVYLDFLNQRSYRPPQIPLMSCVQATVLDTIGKGYFWEVVRKPIRFREALKVLERRQDCLYLDLGPSGTLANFVKYNLPEDSRSKSLAVMTPFGHDLKNLEKIESLFR